MTKISFIRLLCRNPLKAVLCVLLVAVTSVAFAQVVCRYFLHYSLSWSEELARFLFMWITLLGAAYGFKTKSHFSLVFIVNRFGLRLQRIIGGFVVVMCCVFLIIFIVKAIEFIWVVAIHQIAPGTQMNMALPYLSVPVGGLLMLFYILQGWWHEYRKPPSNLEHQKEAE